MQMKNTFDTKNDNSINREIELLVDIFRNFLIFLLYKNAHVVLEKICIPRTFYSNVFNTF